MQPGEIAKRVVAGAVVATLVVAGAAGVGVVTDDRAGPPIDPGSDAYDAEQLVVDPGEADGDLAVDAGEPGAVVLIDMAHDNRVDRVDLQPAVAGLTEAGHEVRFYERNLGPGGTLNDSLRAADAYVVINPAREFSKAEIDGVEAFAAAGGRVLLVGGPADTHSSGGSGFGSVERVPSASTNLASRFGVSFGTGYLYTMRPGQRDNNFRNVYASPAADADLAAGVDRVVHHDATEVSTSDGTTVVTGAEGTRLSSTRSTGTYATVVRTGNVVALGDATLLQTGAVYHADNEVLVANLLAFLVSGDKREGAPGSGGPTGSGANPSQPPAEPSERPERP